MWIYESHIDGLYVSKYPKSFYDLYCDECGCCDNQIGVFDNAKEFLEFYADEIDCEDGFGGYTFGYMFKFMKDNFKDFHMTWDEMKKFVIANRSDDEQIYE